MCLSKHHFYLDVPKDSFFSLYTLGFTVSSSKQIWQPFTVQVTYCSSENLTLVAKNKSTNLTLLSFNWQNNLTN